MRKLIFLLIFLGVAGLGLHFIAKRSLFASKAAADPLFHGFKVNPAVEDRADKYWQSAYRQMSEREIGRKPLNFDGGITQGDPSLNEVALTFDDGPHQPTVHALVQELQDLDLHATFFEVGKMVEKHPELVKEEADAGNEIANHTFSHVNLSKICETEAATEYRACDLLIKKITGLKPKFCRPPGGKYNSSVYEAAAENSLTTILWTDDPRDYSNPGEQVILDRTLRDLKPGAIILLHEGVRQTMRILPTLIREIQDRGYKVVTVGQLLRDSRVAIRDEVPRRKQRHAAPKVDSHDLGRA